MRFRHKEKFEWITINFFGECQNKSKKIQAKVAQSLVLTPKMKKKI